MSFARTTRNYDRWHQNYRRTSTVDMLAIVTRKSAFVIQDNACTITAIAMRVCFTVENT